MTVVYYNKCSWSNINAVRVKHAYQLKRVSQSLTTPQRTCCASPNPRSQPHLHSSHQILPILLDSEFLPRSPCWLPFCRVGGESLAPPAAPLRYSSGSLLSISSVWITGFLSNTHAEKFGSKYGRSKFQHRVFFTVCSYCTVFMDFAPVHTEWWIKTAVIRQ